MAIKVAGYTVSKNCDGVDIGISSDEENRGDAISEVYNWITSDCKCWEFEIGVHTAIIIEHWEKM